MVFSVVMNTHDNIFVDLIQLYFPEGAKIIDFTYGTGSLYWKIFESPYLNSLYKITCCDAVPNPKLKNLDNIIIKNLVKDDYSDLGFHDVGVFDPPYLIGRNGYDYSASVKKGNLIPAQLQGKRSWSADELTKYTGNPSLSVFNERVLGLKQRAKQVIKPEGLLFVKVMDPRYEKKLISHHINIVNTLQPEYELIDHCIYIRQGSTTWKVKNHLQNLHGHWLILKRNSNHILTENKEVSV